jgi:hypothetical protein
VKFIVIFGCSILCLLITSSIFEAFAALEDDVKSLPNLGAQNTRTFERVGEFLQQCADKAATNRPLISTCDSVVLKLNIDMSKFLAENQAVIEEFLYPYFLPSSVHTFTNLNSKNVTGSADPTVFAKHGAIFLDYTKPTDGIMNECRSRGGSALESYPTVSSSDMQIIYKCIGIAKSLNSHLKVFNQNTRLEFEKVLNAPIP